MKYFIHLAYNGSDFHGWQWQNNAVTVQGVIEEKLEAIFKQKITVVGCGRTDRGVHASQYVCHMFVKDDFDFDLKFRLNKNLPDSIVVYDIVSVDKKLHARNDPTWRTYDYFLHRYEDPVLGQYSSYYEIENLDVDAMQQAADLIANHSDFKAACKQPDLYPNTTCHITNVKLYVDDTKQRMRFTITANRFLRGMIRILVGYLLDVGESKLTVAQFDVILSNKLPVDNKRVAFPNGLYLSKIEYENIRFNSQHNICTFLKKDLGG